MNDLIVIMRRYGKYLSKMSDDFLSKKYYCKIAGFMGNLMEQFFVIE